jgi:hypothetical protein
MASLQANKGLMFVDGRRPQHDVSPQQDKVLDQGLTDAQQDKVDAHVFRLMAKPRGTHERFKD